MQLFVTNNSNFDTNSSKHELSSLTPTVFPTDGSSVIPYYCLVHTSALVHVTRAVFPLLQSNPIHLDTTPDLLHANP